jgi:phosphoglycolate phosphatase
LRAAFAALWRIDDAFAAVEFSGRTDRAILRDALVAAALENGSFNADLRRFKRAYFRRLGGTLREFDGRVLPGVVPLLDRLSQDDGAILALGTGNFRTSAAMKLRHYAIDHYFQTGGFGDSTEDRADLIARGLAAARRRHGRYETAFVIGDTPHDIRAARANGVVAVGVATGTSSESDLEAAGADIVLASLEDAASQLQPRY